MEVLYLQESQITPAASNLYQALASDLCSDCNGVTQFAVSVWVQKSSFYTTNWNTIFRVADDET